MGMWDKDKLYGGTPLEDWISKDTDFILHGARIATTEFPLDDGSKATKTELFVAHMDNPSEVVKVSTLSSVIAEKVSEAEEDDFPAVVQFQQVPASKAGYNDAKVLRLRFPYQGDPISFNPDECEDGTPIANTAAPASA